MACNVCNKPISTKQKRFMEEDTGAYYHANCFQSPEESQQTLPETCDTTHIPPHPACMSKDPGDQDSNIGMDIDGKDESTRNQQQEKSETNSQQKSNKKNEYGQHQQERHFH